ncbi:MAG: ABC transporter substrate-binding protein, partial [Gaiellales bacterium]
MVPHDAAEKATRQPVNRRQFLTRVGWGSLGATTLMVAGGRGRASAQAASSYPDWIPASTKSPKRGGTLARASAWDPPVIDPRLTQSVGLFQFAGLTSSRLIRYAFPDEASGTNDLTLKGDLAESWQSSADHRRWTFKLRQGVKWQNVPPLNGRELTAADIKYCYEAYAKEGVQSFAFREIEGIETPEK